MRARICAAAGFALLTAASPGARTGGDEQQYPVGAAPAVYAECSYFDNASLANCALSAALAFDKAGRREEAMSFLTAYTAAFERAAASEPPESRRRLFAGMDIPALSPALRSYVADWAQKKENLLIAQRRDAPLNVAP